MGVTTTQLRALAAVVDQGSFAAAAAALGVSQPAVSATLRQLELVLGGAAVERRTCRPTALGSVVLPRARAVLHQLAALDADVAAARGAPHGTVRLAVVTSVRAALVPRLVRTWAAALPAVVVEVLEGEDPKLPEWLEGGLADLAVLVDPAEEEVGEDAVELAGDRWCAALAIDHPLLAQRVTPAVLHLAELAGSALIASGGCEPQVRALHRSAGLPFRPTAEVSGLASLLAVVAAGSGFSVVPEHARALAPPGVHLVALEPVLHRRLVLSGPVSRARSDLVAPLLSAALGSRAASPPAAGTRALPTWRTSGGR